MGKIDEEYGVQYCESDRNTELLTGEQLQLAGAVLCGKACVRTKDMCSPKLNKSMLHLHGRKVQVVARARSEDFPLDTVKEATNIIMRNNHFVFGDLNVCIYWRWQWALQLLAFGPQSTMATTK